MSRSILALTGVLLVSCGGARPAPRPPLFPLAPSWKTLVGDFVAPPLAADASRVFVATRDGVVRALDGATGAVLWKAEGLSGRLSAQAGALLVRGEGGRLTSLQPRLGTVRWTLETGVAGSLPAVLDTDRALVAGKGLASVDLASGRVLWTDASGPGVTAPPVRAANRILTGEADGALRCRDRESGRVEWQLVTKRPLLAPPLVDEARRRLYLGTADRRVLEVNLDNGDAGWRWTVGADIADAGLLLPGRVLFASFDAVLYALRPGGNLAWRGGLPSRPLAGPLLVAGYVVVPCLENELVAFAPDTGARLGTLRTAAEIRTPPLVLGTLIVVGLRDRSVMAYALPGAPAAVAPPATAP